MIIELRTYRTKPGMRKKFLELFCAHSVPEHDRLGMPIVGPFPCLENPDAFFFMRSFDDNEARDKLKAEFYEGPIWKQLLEKELMPILEHYEFVVVNDPGAKLGEKFRRRK
jgi:hypothetical protein